MGYWVRKSSVLPIMVLALTGCFDASDARRSQQLSPARQVFSEEDKRVARILSIGSEAQNSDATPHVKATLCTIALEAVAVHLENSNLISPQQLQFIDRARTVYRQRAAAGHSAEERARTRSDLEASYPEQRDRARFAIGCLRELA